MEKLISEYISPGAYIDEKGRVWVRDGKGGKGEELVRTEEALAATPSERRPLPPEEERWSCDRAETRQQIK